MMSATSTNMELKVLRACLYSAQKQDLVEKNVAAKVDILKQRGENKRRGFTLAEVGRVLKRCDEAGARRDKMKLFHRTSAKNAANILKVGFRDTTGSYMMITPVTGVWVANRILCAMNRAVLYVVCSIRESCNALTDFLEEQRMRIAMSHFESLTCESSNTVPTVAVNVLRHAEQQ
jgi:hypothetical protein